MTFISLGRFYNEFLVLEQEEVDKSGVSQVYGCDERERGHLAYEEDACLLNCLVEKYWEKFHCLHVRLILALESRGVQDRRRVCDTQDILKRSRDYERKMRTKFKSVPSTWRSEEIGLVVIKNILAAFNVDDPSEANRCGCKIPCKKKMLKLRKYDRRESRAKDGRVSDEDGRVFASIHFQPFVKCFTYHYLYSATKFVADVGGYLGLFLGLSAFSVVEIVESVLKRRRKKKERKSALKNDDEETAQVKGPTFKREKLPTSTRRS